MHIPTVIKQKSCKRCEEQGSQRLPIFDKKVVNSARKCNCAYKRTLKFVFSKKAIKFDEIFTFNLMLTTYCQINSDDFVNFCGLLRKHNFKKWSETVFTCYLNLILFKCNIHLRYILYSNVSYTLHSCKVFFGNSGRFLVLAVHFTTDF